MPAKANTLARFQRRDRGRIGHQPAMEHRQAARAPMRRTSAAATSPRPILADHQQRIAARKLRVERRAQGTGGKHAAIADAAPAVDHGTA